MDGHLQRDQLVCMGDICRYVYYQKVSGRSRFNIRRGAVNYQLVYDYQGGAYRVTMVTRR